MALKWWQQTDIVSKEAAFTRSTAENALQRLAAQERQRLALAEQQRIEGGRQTAANVLNFPSGF
jgi:hypothetical protein